MISLSVKPLAGEASKYGVRIDQLQDNIVVDDKASKITGQLKYYKGYTQFSTNPDEQNGNYLALEFTSDGTVEVEVEGGTLGHAVPVTDGFCVFRLTNKDTQKIKVHVTKADCDPVDKTYSLTEMTFDTDGG